MFLWSDAKEVWQREAWEEGREEGLEKGMVQGIEKEREEILKLFDQGLSIEDIKEKLKR
jgi:flagellar biosynthesis/type III secretory pathway protein FliH